MFSMPAGFQTKIDTGDWKPVYCWKIQDEIGNTYRYVDLDVDIENLNINNGDGAQTFNAATVIETVELESTDTAEIGNSAIQGITQTLAATGIPRDDVLTGKLNRALITVAVFDLADIATGGFVVYRAVAEQTQQEDDVLWNIDLADILKVLDFEPFKRIKDQCSFDFGKPSCRYS